MAILSEDDTLLLLIDIQEKLLNAVYDSTSLLNKADILTQAATILNIPIIYTEQYPKGLGSTVSIIHNKIADSCLSFEKTSFSALDNIDIKSAIKKYNKNQILICGIETHICVSQTAIALKENGYDVYLIKDASGSRSIIEHEAGIQRMNEFGIHNLTTEIALFELLKSSKHPNFKQIQALIK